jgi:hypothetical protein
MCDSTCEQLLTKSSDKQSKSINCPVTNDKSLIISPNPVINTLHVQLNSLPTGDYQITVTDMTGKLVLQKDKVHNSSKLTTDLDFSSLASGVYLLTIKKDELVLQQKVVKQ